MQQSISLLLIPSTYLGTILIEIWLTAYYDGVDMPLM